MTCKYLEISSGENLPRTRFEIVKVEKDIYMLKTIDSHVGLLGTLYKWLKSNTSMDESCYSVMLYEKPSSPIKVLSEIVTTSDFHIDQIDMTQSMLGITRISGESIWDDDAIKMLTVASRPNLESMIENAPGPYFESMIEKAA
jgi:hypothetical protein